MLRVFLTLMLETADYPLRNLDGTLTWTWKEGRTNTHDELSKRGNGHRRFAGIFRVPGRIELVKDTANQRTVIKAKGGTVVQRFELEHR